MLEVRWEALGVLRTNSGGCFEGTWSAFFELQKVTQGHWECSSALLGQAFKLWLSALEGLAWPLGSGSFRSSRTERLVMQDQARGGSESFVG
jgi:hypothetical protein